LAGTRLELIAFIVPLGLDSLGVAVALGIPVSMTRCGLY
jgi:hypothetical protein